MSISSTVLWCAVALCLEVGIAAEVIREVKHEGRVLSHPPIKAWHHALSRHHHSWHHHHGHDLGHRRRAWLRCKMMDLQNLTKSLEEEKRHLLAAEAAATQETTRVEHIILKKGFGAKILKQERRVLSQLTHERENEKGLEIQERRLIWELRSLFVKEAAYRRKMSREESELTKRTRKAEKKLANMKVLIVRILEKIKLLKVMMVKQISKSKMFEQRSAAIVNKGRKYELHMQMKIKSLKIDLEKNEARWRTLLSKRRTDLRDARARRRMLEGELTRSQEKIAAAKRKLQVETQKAKREAKLLQSQRHQKKLVVLFVERLRRELKHTQATEGSLRHRLAGLKNKLHKLQAGFAHEKAVEEQESVKFNSAIKRLKGYLFKKRAQNKKIHAKLNATLMQVKDRRAKNDHEKRMVKEVQTRMEMMKKQSAQEVKVLKRKILETNRKLHDETIKVARMNKLLEQRLRRKVEAMRALKLFKRQSALNANKRHMKEVKLKRLLRHEKHLYHKLRRQYHRKRRWDNELRHKLEKKARDRRRREHEARMLKVKRGKLLNRIKMIKQRRKQMRGQARAMSKRVAGWRNRVKQEQERRSRQQAMHKKLIEKLNHELNTDRVALKNMVASVHRERVYRDSIIKKTQKMKVGEESRIVLLKKKLKELHNAENLARRNAESKLKKLHEVERNRKASFEHWKNEELARLSKWKKIKGREIILEQQREHGLELKQRHLARSHSKHLNEVKQRLSGLENNLSKLKARKSTTAKEEARWTHRLRKTIAREHDHLIRTRKHYRHVIKQVDMYRAKTNKLKHREHVRWVKFQQEFKLLTLKAKSLHDERLRENRRNRYLENEIKKWDHKRLLVDEARKLWRRSAEEAQKKMQRNAKVTSGMRKEVEVYKQKVKEIHAQDLEKREHIRKMREKLEMDKRLVEQLRAMVREAHKKAKQELVVLTRERLMVRRKLAWIKAKHLKDLMAHRRLKKHALAEIVLQNARQDKLKNHLSHEEHTYSWARHELNKVKQEGKLKYAALARKMKAARKRAVARELATEKSRLTNLKWKWSLRFRKLQKRREINMTLKRKLERKLKLEKLQTTRAMRRAQRERKQKHAEFMRQKAHLLLAERNKRQKYSQVLAHNKHLQSQERKMESMLKETLKKEHEYEKQRAEKKKTLEETWKHKIDKTRKAFARLHAEVVGLIARIAHLRQHEKRDTSTLSTLKLRLTKVMHRNHLAKLHLQHLAKVLKNQEWLLKRRSAKIKAERGEQQKALEEETRRKKVVEHELISLRNKLVLERKNRKLMNLKYKKMIGKERKRLAKMISDKNVMTKNLDKWEGKVKREEQKAKAERQANALSLEHVRQQMRRKLKHARMVLGNLTTKVNAMSKRLSGVKMDIHNERVKARVLAQKYEREKKADDIKWQRKHLLIDEKIVKAVHANRKLEKEIRRAKVEGGRNLKLQEVRYLSDLRREKLRWRSRRHKEKLREKNLRSRMKHLRRMRIKLEDDEDVEKFHLKRFKAKVEAEHRELNFLKEEMKAVDRNGAIKLKKERTRFNRMISHAEANVRIVKAHLAKLHAALITEGIKERQSLLKVQRDHKLQVARSRAKADSKMHQMYVNENTKIAKLRESASKEQQKLVREKAHFAKELARLVAQGKNDKRIRLEEIRVLKVQIKKIKAGTKLKLKSMKAKWKGKVAEWKKAEGAKMAKLNTTLMQHEGQLSKEKLEVVRRNKEDQQKISSLQHELMEKNLLYKKWLQKVTDLKGRKSLQITQLKHVEGDITKFLHLLVVYKRTIQKSREVQEKLARAVRKLKGKQQNWKLLQKKQALVQGQLSRLTKRVVLIQQKIAAEGLKMRMFTKRMHHKFMQKSLKLRGESSDESRLRDLWAKTVTKLRKMHAKLKTLKKRRATQEKRISSEVANVKRLTLEVKNVRGIISRTQMKVRSETLSLSKHANLLNQNQHKVAVLQGNLTHARSKFDVDGRRIQKGLLHIEQQKHWNKQLDVKLNSLHKGLRALKNNEKRSLAHERHVKKELQLVEKKIEHIEMKMRSQEKKFKLGLQVEKKKEAEHRRHAIDVIHSLTLKLTRVQELARGAEKEKHALSNVRARLLTWLKLEKGRWSEQRKNQRSLKKKLHGAVMEEKLLESELKKQMKVTEHLKALLGCGKWRSMANREKKYSELLRKEGLTLSRLARELYSVERKVRNLTIMLKRGARESRTQAILRKRELERAKRLVKRAQRMIKEEKSHKW